MDVESWLDSVGSTDGLTSALEDFSQLVSKTPGLMAIIACDAVEKMLALLAREVVCTSEFSASGSSTGAQRSCS